MNSEEFQKNLQNLVSNLNDICEYLDNKFDINSGGCCFVAACIAEMLEEDCIDYSVVVEDYDELPDNWDDGDYPKHHYGLLIQNQYWINFDEDNEDYFCHSYDNVTSYDLACHYMDNDWNSLYDSTKNYFIKKILRDYYEEFSKDLSER